MERVEYYALNQETRVLVSNKAVGLSIQCGKQIIPCSHLDAFNPQAL